MTSTARDCSSQPALHTTYPQLPRLVTSIAWPRFSTRIPAGSTRPAQTGDARCGALSSSVTKPSSGCCSIEAPIPRGRMQTRRREALRCMAEDPSSASAGCGGVLTAVCTRGKRDLLVRLLDMGVRVPPVAGGCQSYLLENPEMLRLLLASGLSPDYRNWQNLTFLHLLCSRDVRNRTMAHRTECASILLEAGATMSPRDDGYRSTPLAWAARNNLPDMVEFLLGRGAPTSLPDDELWATPLAWATARGHSRIFDQLRAAGATR